MSDDIRQSIYDLLKQLPTGKIDTLKKLFWAELNYHRANEPLSTRNWPAAATEALAEPPTLFATAGENDGFQVIYTQLADDRLLLTRERPVISHLLQNHPYALFVFSDSNQANWHFVNVRYEKDANTRARRVFRRITVGPHERLRTATERISILDVAGMPGDLFGLSPLTIQQKHDEAFNVEAVTDQFFKAYKATFGFLQADLTQQTGNARWAHDYALQFLNRLMFLYYVQRKNWLGDDPDFLATFWHAYRKATRPADTFFKEWLSLLFFEAFNNKFQAGRTDLSYLPEPIRNALAMAPYLNGGLFTGNELDRLYPVEITDTRFAEIFKFLDSYNFTISEDTPLDQEVAVDPEMIGKVYESLVNVSEEADERGEAGIFYTPRIEIDLMGRLSLVDWLTNHLGEPYKKMLYELVFAFDPADKDRADAAAAEHNLWPRLDELLRSITIVDPACGSGSFLVGMLYILDDLLARANRQSGRQETPYDRKKNIIGNSLYGVDVMTWAVHVAELRLWLQLVIDTDLHPAQLKFMPLLPNLSFKIRPGDSLVQEVGGFNLALRHGTHLISSATKGKINQLKGEKIKFYNNVSDRKYKSADLLAFAELQLFRDLLEDRLNRIEARLQEISQSLRPQVNLFGEIQNAQMGLERVTLEQEQERLTTERDEVARARRALTTVKDIPFVWDIAFVEVFEGDRKGFDIVIGNPPYVRQEMIRDPHQPPEEVTTAGKQAYKAKLARSIYANWPRTFGYDWSKDTARWKLDAKSDLYIYFYFYGLSLLNDTGAFCFITSNSWLDVGYGKDLQEFLLTRGHVKLILDNQGRRSFASADVNTVIALLGPAHDAKMSKPTAAGKTARFVMLTVPFEQTLDPVIWQEVDEAKLRHTTPDYRIFPLSHTELLKNGLEPDKPQFAGDKWGGKYLRAPDIYWVILEKNRGKFVSLKEVAEVRFGIKSGVNEFFYLEEEQILRWGIEETFLSSIIKSPRECKGLVINPSTLKFKLFTCPLPREQLKGTATLDYIKWGESQNFHLRPSTCGRNSWYDLGERRIPPFTSPSSFSDFCRIFKNGKVLVDKRLYEIYPHFDENLAFIALNTTLNTLFLELGSRTGLGQGLLDLTVYELADCPILHPKLIKELSEVCIHSLKNRDILPISEEIYQPDRKELDDMIFDILGLTQIERDEIYHSTLKLVLDRLKKAESV